MEKSNNVTDEIINKKSSNKKNDGSDINSNQLVKTVKRSFIIAISCIVCLTLIASYILLSNHYSQNTANNLINNSATSCRVDTLSESITVDSIANGVIANNDRSSTTESESGPSDLLNSIVYNLTLAVNSVNNVLTSGSIFIAILTLFIGLVGLFGYHSLKTDVKDDLKKTIANVNEKEISIKNDINEKLKTTTKRINDIEVKIKECCEKSNNQIVKLNEDIHTLKEEVNEEIDQKISNFDKQITDFNNRVEEIKFFMMQQTRFFDQSINYLYQTSYSNIEQMEDQTQANQLLEDLYHELQIAKLYRTSLDEDERPTINIQKIAALEYLEGNGIKSDIPHIEYVAQHDPNKENRDQAKRIIGRIEERDQNKNNKETSQDESQIKVSNANNKTNKNKPRAKIRPRKKRR